MHVHVQILYCACIYVYTSPEIDAHNYIIRLRVYIHVHAYFGFPNTCCHLFPHVHGTLPKQYMSCVYNLRYMLIKFIGLASQP